MPFFLKCAAFPQPPESFGEWQAHVLLKERSLQWTGVGQNCKAAEFFCDLINQIYALPIKGLRLLFNKSGSHPWHRGGFLCVDKSEEIY